ncbi:MAG: hypothetical protein ACI350_01035 [Prevotella sp.]
MAGKRRWTPGAENLNVPEETAAETAGTEKNDYLCMIKKQLLEVQ